MDLLESLVRSEALRIAPPGQVFWYTSGTVGPYYINTHFLFGGPERAGELLAFIDAESRSADFHARLQERVSRQLASDPGYAGVIDALAASIRGREPEGGVDWVSGGERRDWFFSTGAALRTGLPHLYLYKDSGARMAEGNLLAPVEDLRGRRTAHVADLVTEASSYQRAWIPALRGRGGDMAVSANVVDRGQGGMEVIAACGVDAEACLRVDGAMFAELHRRGLISADQHAVLADYLGDPGGAMRRFLVENPAFLQDALGSKDERTAQRARLLVEQDPYGLRLG